MLSYGARYDAMVEKPLFAEIFGRSGFFNVGLWGPGIEAPAEAASRLAATMIERVPRRARRLLEAGGGSGGTARLAAEVRPELHWTLSDLSLTRLRGAIRADPEVSAVSCDACRLPFRSGSFDAVVAIEAVFHFPSRAEFLREALRLLHPGGSLLLTDLALDSAGAIGDWLMPEANRVASGEEYAALFAEAGFEDARIEDWTDLSWRPFLRYLATRDLRMEARGEMEAAARQVASEHRAALEDPGAGFVGYFAVSARRPDPGPE